MRLEVATFNTGCTEKEQAVKVLEEAAEVFGAWQSRDGLLANEIADVITAACNLAERYGIDMEQAMLDCAMRNHKRGRC